MFTYCNSNHFSVFSNNQSLGIILKSSENIERVQPHLTNREACLLSYDESANFVLYVLYVLRLPRALLFYVFRFFFIDP